MRTKPELRQSDRGIYYIHWSERVDGKMRTMRKTTGTDDYAEAVMQLSRFLSDDVIEIRAKKTVAEVCEAYLRLHADPRGNTIEPYNLRAPLLHFGDWPAGPIRDDDIQHYIRKREMGHYGNRKVSQSTIRRELKSLQAALNFGIRKRMIHGVERINLTKPSEGHRRELWLTEEQQREVMEGLTKADLSTRLYARLGLTYGVRRGAMLDLVFGPQIDWLANTIDFNAPGKRVTRKRRPVVPMTSTVRADMDEMFSIKGIGESVIDPTTPKRFERWMDRIGYPWVTSHVMKHTAITSLLRAKVPPGDVARLTATDLRTIYSVYRHHQADELRSIAEMRGL